MCVYRTLGELSQLDQLFRVMLAVNASQQLFVQQINFRIHLIKTVIANTLDTCFDLLIILIRTP